jgi:phosphohistidine phosphatase
MRLYLARHGQAMTREEDPGRPLSSEGRREVAKVSDLLEQMNASVDRILHSGKPRAQQTAEILAQSVLYDVEMEQTTGMDPSDPVEPWGERLSQFEEDTMMVGHLPFLSNLLSYLVCGSVEPEIVRFSSGCVACLERSDKGKWAVAAVIRPGL